MTDTNKPTTGDKSLFFIELKNNLLDLEDFTFACLLNDVYLKEYRYWYAEDTGHTWLRTNSYTPLASCLRPKDIRLFIMNDVFEWFSNYQNELLREAIMYKPSDPEHEQIQRLIKKVAYVSLCISNGKWYLKFIDCVSKL
jgi:hypothetical protein